MNDTAPPPRWIRWTPNTLSTARLALAALFPFAPAAWWPAMIIAAGATDLADGFIARRFGAASWIGGLLDGIADKLFVFTALVTFAFHEHLEAWQVAVLLCRDLTVGSLAGYAAAIRNWEAFRRMPARLLGKITTAVMFVLLLVLALPLQSAWPAEILTLATSVFSVTSALDYFVQFLRAKRLRVAGGWAA